MPAFAVDTERRDGVDVIRLHAPDATAAEIVPAWGGSCIAFRSGDAPVLEPVAFAEVANKPTSYGIPILFPFPNRIRDGRFTFEGREIHAEPARHGFVRDKPWTIVASGATESEGASLTLALDATDFAAQILTSFPFPFQIAVTYRLRAGSLALEAVARNTGDRTMPVGFGIHPYFHVPEGGTVRVPAESRWELADSLPTGRILAATERYDLRTPRPVNGLELDDIFTNLDADSSGQARCMIEDPAGRRRTVIEFDSEALPEVVVYTPPAPRRAICVEPQSCPTDAFNLAARGIDAHVVRLGPGAEMHWAITLRVDGIP